MGTLEQIFDNFRALEQAGKTYAILYFPELAWDTSDLKLLDAKSSPP